MTELDVESIDELFEKHNKRVEILEKIAEAAFELSGGNEHNRCNPDDCVRRYIQVLKKELEQ